MKEGIQIIHPFSKAWNKNACCYYSDEFAMFHKTEFLPFSAGRCQCPTALVHCRRESIGTKVWKEYLSFTFELSSMCPEAYSSLNGGCISSFYTASIKKKADRPFTLNQIVSQKLRQSMWVDSMSLKSSVMDWNVKWFLDFVILPFDI